MGFSEEVETAGREMGAGGDYYKFVEGANRVRIMSEPLIEVSRFGHGICYEGAPYCQKEALEKEEAKAKRDAEKEGKDPSKVTVKLSKKWNAWAILRGDKGDKFVILQLTYGLSKELKELMGSDEAGWKSWPMPFDINFMAKDNGKKFNGRAVFDYQILTDRKDTPITADEQAEFDKLTPYAQIQERKKAKAKAAQDGGTAPQSSSAIEYPSEDIDPADIPF